MTKERIIKKLIEQQMFLMKFWDYLEYKEVSWFEECKCDLVDLILELLEVPEDNTVEMEKKYGKKWYEVEETFCRDAFFDVLYEYDGDIENVYNALMKLKDECLDIEVIGNNDKC